MRLFSFGFDKVICHQDVCWAVNHVKAMVISHGGDGIGNGYRNEYKLGEPKRDDGESAGDCSILIVFDAATENILINEPYA